MEQNAQRRRDIQKPTDGTRAVRLFSVLQWGGLLIEFTVSVMGAAQRRVDRVYVDVRKAGSAPATATSVI